MIIFGWGHQSMKNFGVTFKHKCPNCNNEDYWQLIRMTTWFTLFFIPVIPYENKYVLICPVCEKGVRVERANIDEYKNLAIANTDLINGKITSEEYKSRLEGGEQGQLQSAEENNIQEKEKEGEIIEIDESEITPTKVDSVASQPKNKFCTNCGNSLQSGHKFCQKCGNKTS
jgi:phage terminase large subunit GpA-like protein